MRLFGKHPQFATFLVCSAAAALPAAAAAAPKPKPWMWTPAQAAAKASAASGVKTGCRGVGKQTAKRWTRFRCTGHAWLAVRPVKQGQACVSFVSLAATARCVKARQVVAVEGFDADDKIRWKLRDIFTPDAPYSFQGLTSLGCRGVDGWYECVFSSGDIQGAATVASRKAGATVTITRLVCTGDYEGECG